MGVTGAGRPRCGWPARRRRAGSDAEVADRAGGGRPGARASIPSGAASGRRRSSPGPTLVELCLRRARRGGSDAAHARHMALRTLDAMAAGGIYDHLVGGFCRYSTDAHWLVPHFEKMLTDQALLARAYLHAWQDGGRAEYLGVVTETLDFVLRRPLDPRGRARTRPSTPTPAAWRARTPPSRSRSCARSCPASLVGPAAEWYGITPGGNWEGRSIPVRPVGAPLARPPEVEEARVLLAAARAAAGPAGPGREGADRVERHDGGHAGRGGGRHRPERLRAPRRGDRRVPLGVHVRRRTAHAQLAGRAGATSRRGGGLRLAGRGVLPAVRVDGHGAVARAGGPRPCTSCSTCSGTRRPAGSSPPGATPRRSSSARRSSSTAPCRPPTPSPSPPCCTSAPSSTTPEVDEAVERTVGLAGPLLERHPGALADMVAALPMVERPQRDRGHGGPARSARRGARGTGSRPRSSPGASPTTARSSRSGRPSPGWPTSARGASCRMPAADAATLAGQLETLIE